MGKERRRAPRFAIRHLIELGFGKEKFVRATGLNISSSGLLCITDPPIELYRRVYLSLLLPGKEGDEIIDCEGIVVRIEESDTGRATAIAFTGLRPKEAATLVGLLRTDGPSLSS